MKKIFIPPLKFRIIIFVVLLLFMFFGPFYKQVLNGESKIFRQWEMWRKTGEKLYHVEFYEISKNGDSKFINYQKAVYNKTTKANIKRLKRIYKARDLDFIVKILCIKKKKDSYLRMYLRKFSREGWIVLYDKDENICSTYQSVINSL